MSLVGRYIEGFSRSIFNLSGTALAAFILGCVSGYPSGAALSRSLYDSGEIDLLTAKRLCSVCVCAGPAFILLGVGDGLLHSRTAGRILLCAHILSAFLMLFFGGLFAKIRHKKPQKSNNQAEKTSPKTQTSQAAQKPDSFGISAAVTGAVQSGARSMLGICAYTVLFSAVISVFGGLMSGGALSVLTAACEVTNACAYLANSHNVPMISAALGFSGFSVIAQVISAAGAVCDIRRLIVYRILSAAFSFAICSLLLIVFPCPLAVQSGAPVAAFYISSGTMTLSCLLLAAAAVFLYSLYQRTEPDLHDFF